MAGIRSSQQSLFCLICNSRVGVSARNALSIFNSEIRTSTEKLLSHAISDVLGEEIAEDSVHSLLLCKKCFKLVDEVEELEQRADELRHEFMTNYRRSVEMQCGTMSEDDSILGGGKKATNRQNEVPKKILDIPSSDDDTQGLGDRNLNSMEDIEVQLDRIHGGERADGSTVSRVVFSGPQDEITEFDVNMVDAGATEHSSDTEYEADDDNADELLEAAAIAERNLVKVKVEPDVKKDKRKEVVNEKKVKIKEELGPVVNREGNFYTCLLCTGENIECGDAKSIIQHVREIHDMRLYICDVCGLDFPKRNELSAHLDEHVAAEEGDFQCEVCHRIFCNLRLFRIHKRMHYPQNKPWPCEICNKKYSSKNLLEEHKNTHTGVRPYVCSTCGKDFASKYTFKAHEKTHMVRARPFQCLQCNKTFLSQQNLSQHERTHLGVKEFECQLCGKQFGSAHNLEVHSIIHTGFKPFICGVCGKAFARKAEIKDHERTHTGEKPYQCEFCGSTFSQRSNLQSHKRATHYDDKRYKCEECGKGFKRRRLLDYHVKAAHTGERPYKCQTCDATFVYPEHFKKHRRIHTGEKPYKCEVCHKAFNSRDNRNAHRFVHSDKKPYECLVCGAGFMRKPLLYQHMQSQDHLNDTIVVNQPRLTTDDNQVITVNAEGEMEIVEDSLSALQGIEIENEEDSKLYITEFVEGSEMFTDTKAFMVDEGAESEEQMDESEAVEQIIISEGYDDGEGEEREIEDEEIVTGTKEEFEEISIGKTQIVQGPDGPIQLVQVSIPKEDGELEQTWLRVLRK